MSDMMISAGIGLAAGGAVGFFFERLRRGASYQDRDQILEQAKRDAETLKRDEELKAREELLKKREEMEASLNDTRDGLHQRERDLDKREGGLDDRDDEFVKREKMIEGQQQKLTTRGKAMEVKEKELDRLLAEEQDKLVQISSLTPDQAKDLLLDRLDRQLKDETGGLILKYESELKNRQEELS